VNIEVEPRVAGHPLEKERLRGQRHGQVVRAPEKGNSHPVRMGLRASLRGLEVLRVVTGELRLEGVVHQVQREMAGLQERVVLVVLLFFRAPCANRAGVITLTGPEPIR
jgi:hypothetical protein